MTSKPRVGAWVGTWKNPTKCLWRREPDRRYNFFSSPPAHLCCHIYNWNIVACDVKHQYTAHPTDQTFYQFHDLDTELDIHGIKSGFQGAFATGVACPQGTCTIPDTWFRPFFIGDLVYASVVETSFPELAVSFFDFSFWLPLGTFYTLKCRL